MKKKSFSQTVHWTLNIWLILFLFVFPVADERGLLDSLILSEIYRSSKYVQTGVATYLEFAPKTVQNQIRLLRLFISARNLEEAISLYKIMFREWRDRRLLREVDRVAFAEAEVGLKKLMILTQDRFGVMPAKKPKPTRKYPGIRSKSNQILNSQNSFASLFCSFQNQRLWQSRQFLRQDQRTVPLRLRS